MASEPRAPRDQRPMTPLEQPSSYRYATDWTPIGPTGGTYAHTDCDGRIAFHAIGTGPTLDASCGSCGQRWHRRRGSYPWIREGSQR